MATYMVRLFKAFLFFIVVFCATLLVSNLSVRKAYADEVWGSHAYCWANQTIFDLIWSTYGGNNWYPVTVMIGVDGNGATNLDTLFKNATSGGKKLYPILRLTSQGGATSWSKIDPNAAAAMLNSVTPSGFPGPIYVSFGNETHMSNEWGGVDNGISQDYWAAFKSFASQVNGNYVVGHAGVNLSYPPGASGDTAEEFYDAGKAGGYLGGSKVLFSNPYDLTVANVTFPGTRHMSGALLNIPNHVSIDRWYADDAGGTNSPNIFMEFGLHPGQPISDRQNYLERAYAGYPGGVFSSITPEPKYITPMLMDATEKYIVVFKADGDVAYIQCSGTSCGGEICAGGSASDNPTSAPPVITGPIGNTGSNYGTDEPACVPDKGLEIKSTVKSTRKFTKDPMTDGFVSVSDSAAGQGNIPLYTNQVVNGALICVYHSNRLESLEYGAGGSGVNRVYNNSSKVGGKVSGLYAGVRTGEDGTFTVNAVNSCGSPADVWEVGGYKQYLAVLCGDQTKNGQKSLILKDLYGFYVEKDKDDPEAKIKLKDIYVDCEDDPAQFGSFTCPPSLEYILANSNSFMACSGIRPPDTSKNLGYYWGDRLLFKFEANLISGIIDWLWNLFGKILEGEFNQRRDDWYNSIPFMGETWGRTAYKNQDMDTSVLSYIPCFFGGCGGEYFSFAKYYPGGAPATDPVTGKQIYTYTGGKEQMPNLPLCENLQKCNRGVAFDQDLNLNMQTCGGTYFTLSPPYDNDLTGSVMGNAARFLLVFKTNEICRDSAGAIHTFGEFKPPEQFCGDLNKDTLIQNREVDCANPAAPFTFDDSYFPYFALLNVEQDTDKPLGDRYEERTSVDNDVGTTGCIRKGEYLGKENVGLAPDKTTRPDEGECHDGSDDAGSRAFKGQTSIVFPGGLFDQSTTKDTVTNINLQPEFSSAPGLIMTPGFKDKEEANLANAAKQVSFTSTTGRFFRIGLLDRLCGCFSAENGDNTGYDLLNCVTDAANGSVPESKKLANLFTPLDDETYRGGYPEFDGQVASAGAAEYHYIPEDNPEQFNRRLDPVKVEDSLDRHYLQQASTLSGILAAIRGIGRDILDFANCAFNPDVINGVTQDYTTNNPCGRKLPVLSKSSTVSPWSPVKSMQEWSTNFLVFSLSLDAPVVAEGRNPMVNSMQDNMEMTKVENEGDLLGSGIDDAGYGLTKYAPGYSPNTFGNYIIGAVSTPAFGGSESDVVDTSSALPPPPPADPGDPGDPGGPGGTCDATVSMSCNCSGMTVSASGVWTGAVGDMQMEIKGGGAPICQTFLQRWNGSSYTLPCSVPAGSYECHSVLAYNGNVCGGNQTQNITCP